MMPKALFFGCVWLLLLAGACKHAPSEKELRNQAQALESEDKFEAALRTYEALLEAYPNGEYAAETVQRIAYIYYNNFKDFYKAIQYHQKLIEEYPESRFVSQARFMIGYIYANDLHDYDSAEAAYNDFLKHHPNHELVESVKWELEHLGQDINEQLKDLFGHEQANGDAKIN